MQTLVQQIIDNPVASLAVVGNLVIIESLLSVDNAAVLATMVKDLPIEQRKKALKYGLFGAYIFRGLAILFASFLIKIWWLKPLGGLYLLYLVYNWWKGRWTEQEEAGTADKKNNWIYKRLLHALGPFWSTVALVELMDMAFSIDNVFAAVAFSNNIILICAGVFIGILAMRFVAQAFVRLIHQYQFLETSAFVVIALLGIKLLMSVYEHFYPLSRISVFLLSHTADVAVSVITIAIFLIPILSAYLFNYPNKHNE